MPSKEFDIDYTSTVMTSNPKFSFTSDYGIYIATFLYKAMYGQYIDAVTVSSTDIKVIWSRQTNKLTKGFIEDFWS